MFAVILISYSNERFSSRTPDKPRSILLLAGPGRAATFLGLVDEAFLLFCETATYGMAVDCALLTRAGLFSKRAQGLSTRGHDRLSHDRRTDRIDTLGMAGVSNLGSWCLLRHPGDESPSPAFEHPERDRCFHVLAMAGRLDFAIASRLDSAIADRLGFRAHSGNLPPAG